MIVQISDVPKVKIIHLDPKQFLKINKTSDHDESSEYAHRMLRYCLMLPLDAAVTGLSQGLCILLSIYLDMSV